MADTSQKLYRQSVLRFARTIRIKFKADAEAMNRDIPYLVDDSRPETWPYYMHLAGQYHPTDTMMRVISVDTRQEIDFTYDNLLKHRGTFVAYQVGTPYYRELLNKYPDQEDLIRGILHPVPMEVSIPAKDFDILYYDRNEVEPHETNLIPLLQDRIRRHGLLYYQDRYNLTQELYQCGYHVVLYMAIPQMINSIRKENIRTEFVHSFYLWSYLGSHQRLNRYRDVLTMEQALWFYKNIRHIEANAGKTETFEELINWVLTKRSIPIAGYEMWHNIKDIPTEILPDIEMAKLPLNRYAYSPLGIERSTVNDILDKEVNIAPYNKDIIDDKRLEIPKIARVKDRNKFNTKVLESEMVDRTDAVKNRLADVLLNHWLLWSSTGVYQSMVNVIHPNTQEMLTMSAKEAAILWLYTLYRTYDIDVIDIPTVLVDRVARPTIPSFAELRDIAPPHYVSNDMIHIAMQEYTPVDQIVSIEEFYRKASSVYRNHLAHDYMVDTRDTHARRGYFENVTLRFYMRYRCTFVEEPMSFLHWFNLKNWKMDNLSKNQYQELGNEIVAVATGLNMRDQTTMKEIQKAMLEIMTQLSSYSVQYLRKINESPMTILGLIATRLNPEKIKTGVKYGFKVGIDLDSPGLMRTKHKFDLGLGNSYGVTQAKVGADLRFRVPMNVDVLGRSRIVNRARIKIPSIRIDVKPAPSIEEGIERNLLNGLAIRHYANPDISKGVNKTTLGGLKTFAYPKDESKTLGELFPDFVLDINPEESFNGKH